MASSGFCGSTGRTPMGSMVPRGITWWKFGVATTATTEQAKQFALGHGVNALQPSAQHWSLAAVKPDATTNVMARTRATRVRMEPL